MEDKQKREQNLKVKYLKDVKHDHQKQRIQKRNKRELKQELEEKRDGEAVGKEDVVEARDEVKVEDKVVEVLDDGGELTEEVPDSEREGRRG